MPEYTKEEVKEANAIADTFGDLYNRDMERALK